MPGYVYGVEFHPPYKHAQAYLGSTRNLKRRYQEHVSGNGSPLIKAAIAAGCECNLISVKLPKIRDARRLEAKLKRWHNNRKALELIRLIID